ncbi:MAG: TlpA family protein disulfide reductase [Oligoflexales bacterium]
MLKLIFFTLTILHSSVSLAVVTEFDQLVSISDTKTRFNDKTDTQLVVFWATWCGECKKKLVTTLPEWNKQTKLNVVSINIDANSERANSFLDREKIGIQVFKEENSSLQKSLKVISVPHWAVFKKLKPTGDSWELIEHGGGFDEKKILQVIGGKVS